MATTSALFHHQYLNGSQQWGPFSIWSRSRVAAVHTVTQFYAISIR